MSDTIVTILFLAGLSALGAGLWLARRPAHRRIFSPLGSPARKSAVLVLGLSGVATVVSLLLFMHHGASRAETMGAYVGGMIAMVSAIVVGYTSPSKREVRQHERLNRNRDRPGRS